MQKILDLLSDLRDAYLMRKQPSNPEYWHKWAMTKRVTLIDGSKSEMNHGQIWRRRVGDRWEYKQDPETWDEFADRQW